MDDDFFARQSRLHDEISRALIDAVPADWDEAVLELDLFRLGDAGEECARLIYRPTPAPDRVEPSGSLIAATERLIRLFDGCGPAWRRAVFGVRRVPGEGWQSTVRLTY